MKLSGVFSLLAAHVALASALGPRAFKFAHEPNLSKRGAETNATLYAYGTDVSEWPIAYSYNDSNLYVVTRPDKSSAFLTAMTFDLASITGENWVVNGTFPNGTAAGSLFIRPDGNNAAIGVAPYADIFDIEGIVSGFALFATQLVYNNNTELNAQFWAQPASGILEGVCALIWVIDDTNVPDGSFPVVVKAAEN